MAPRSLGYRDYLKAAFYRKVDVPSLGLLPLNLMGLGVFAVLGLANPGFWLLGAAAEVAYLFGLSASRRFQKLVHGEELLEAQEAWEGKVTATVDRLSAPSRDRYRRLLGQCRLILGLSESLDADSLGNYRDLRSRSLNQLLWIFLRLLTSRELIADNVSDLDRKALEEEAAKLERRLADVDAEKHAALARSLNGTLAITKKRLENLGRASGNLDVIDAELLRIEQQVELIREESAVTGSPELLSARLDAVSSTMGETSRWMDEHAEFFGSLVGEETAPSTADLPRASEMLEGE